MRKILLIIIFLLQITMAGFTQTTFFFEESSTSDVIPSTTGWTASGNSIIRRMLPTGFKQTTTIASTNIIVDFSSAAATTLFYRGVSPPLNAQTISGTVTGYFRLDVSNVTGCTAQSRVKITVINRAGTIVATLLAITSGASNLTNTLTSYQVLNAAALSSYACATGDRIVVEVGIGRSVGTTSRTGDISFGSSSATNISAAGSTTANNPVVTFSGNISFYNGIVVYQPNINWQTELVIRSNTQPLMTIRNRDTVISDTMGLIRYLLKEHESMTGEIQKYQKQLYKASVALESINSVMFYQPKRQQFLKL